jgi:glycosyltransferase involved in cell wall biosynthesis
MAQQTRLLLLIPHLGGGGAEQVTAQLARNLDPGQFEIHLCLITQDQPGAKPIPTWVQVHRLHRRRVRHAWLSLLWLIHARQPAVILSGMAHLNFLVLLLKPLLPASTRILVRQNTTASSAAQTWLSRLPYRWLYPRADAILCQSEAMAADLAANFNIAPAKLKVLANPIDVDEIRAAASLLNSPSSHLPSLLVIGRLSPEKGIDLLLRALPEIRRQHLGVRLTILGAGPEEANLRRLSLELGLESATTFAGFRENLAKYFAEATLFILPSRYEGLPNALLEAAAAGLPLVATPCSPGLSNLLHNAPGTWLAHDLSVKSLAQAILTALATLGQDKPAPGTPDQDTPQRFHHAFLAPFETRTAIAAYGALIRSTAGVQP